MIIALTNLSYKNLNFSEFIKQVCSNNFKYIEIAPTLVSKNFYRDKKKIKKILYKEKIEAISLQSIFYNFKKIDLKNKKDFSNLINYVKKIISFCSYLKIDNISIGSCPSRKLQGNQSEIYKYNIVFFSKFAEIAKKKNIVISIEPISKKYGNLFLNNSYEALEFIIKLNKKNVKLVLDTGNCKYEKKNFKTFFLKYGKYINHIQISDKNINKLNIHTVKKELIFFKKKKLNKTTTIEYLSEYGKYSKDLKNLK